IANADPTYGAPRVFKLGQYFIIGYARHVGGAYSLEYIAVNTNTFAVSAPAVFAINYQQGATIAWNGLEANGVLYLAWASTIPNVRMAYISPTLVLSPFVVAGLNTATTISLSAEPIVSL